MSTAGITREVLKGQLLAPVLASAVIFALVGLYFALRNSFQLAALFAYTIAANSFIPFPHEPAVLYYGGMFHPVTVALVCGAATCLSALIDTRALGALLGCRKAREVKASSRLFAVAKQYFKLTPFWTIAFAGFSPVPFYPFRIIALASDYAGWRYICAVFVGRTPRYFILAWAGKELSNYLSVRHILFLLILMALPPVLKGLSGRVGQGKVSARNEIQDSVQGAGRC